MAAGGSRRVVVVGGGTREWIAIVDSCHRCGVAHAAAGSVEVGIAQIQDDSGTNESMLKRIALTMVIFGAVVAAPSADNWPQWRGPSLNGLSSEKKLPVRWSKNDNITWSLPLPAWSGSTPIVWGDRIFLNVAENNDLYLWCVDRARGVPVWKQRVGGGNVRIMKQNMSTPSPVTDGKTVWVMTGTGILKAFDFAGKELWMRDIQKDYGRFGQL